MSALATPDEMTAAHRIGAAAYGYPNSVRAPGADASLLRLIGDVPVGQPRTITLMECYGRGWDACADVTALAALGDGTVPGLTLAHRLQIGQDAADRFLSPPCQDVSAAGRRRALTRS